MRRRLILGFLVLCTTGLAQTTIERMIPIQKNQALSMVFTEPDLIRIQTWNRNEISVKGTISINRGENDDAFDLQVTSTQDGIKIEGILKDKENIPRRILIKKGETEYYFKTDNHNDPEVRKFIEANGGDYAYMSDGIITQIELEIFVPDGVETDVTSKFGLVEVKAFKAPLSVNSKFGGIDASLATPNVGELIARTRFGEILTNLDIPFDSDRDGENNDHWTTVSAKPGTGPRYLFESKFGKVYLRKSL